MTINDCAQVMEEFFVDKSMQKHKINFMYKFRAMRHLTDKYSAAIDQSAIIMLHPTVRVLKC